jgi:hypothetical protein
MDEGMKGYPKYQYSVFLRNGRDEQIVIRSDNFDEFLTQKANVNKILDKVEQPAEGKPAPAPTAAKEPSKLCPEHGVPMFDGVSKTKTTPNGTPRAYQWHKGPDGRMCFGDGWKDKS